MRISFLEKSRDSILEMVRPMAAAASVRSKRALCPTRPVYAGRPLL